MKKAISIITAALLVTGLSIAPASAKKRQRHMQSPPNAMTTGSAPMRTQGGNNAAMMGNNGNSAQGSNAITNIQGGNSGSGR